MTQTHHQLARAFFAAVTSGHLPDTLLTPDMTAWTTMSGTTDKAGYQDMIERLAAMCSRPLTFTINSLTAEEDRVVAEAQSRGTLINGEEYQNTYVFVFRVRDGRISSVAEHFNAIVVREKMLPLMKTM